LFGPLLGTTAFLLLEEYLPHVIDLVYTGGGVYWQLYFGIILILVVLYMKGGINGFLSRREGSK
ncbi:MAG: branched-chain amino acid ABC transporter permease, partial [Alphaproteobacteria bacterium]|nr:branched-chain amino acid ABC transporter permease [Alphaproteobacteria bacterium]